MFLVTSNTLSVYTYSIITFLSNSDRDEIETIAHNGVFYIYGVYGIEWCISDLWYSFSSPIIIED